VSCSLMVQSQFVRRLTPCRFLSAAAMTVASVVHMTSAAPAQDQSVMAFKNVPVEFEKDLQDGATRSGIVVRDFGQTIETTIDLPQQPIDQKDARRILITVIVKPVMVRSSDRTKPADPWTRVGSVTVQPAKSPQRSASASSSTTAPAAQTASQSEGLEVMRFITPFGAEATYSQDVTALAPALSGPTVIRLSLTSFKKPAWTVSLKIDYTSAGPGYRRPMYVAALFRDESVRSESQIPSATVVIPAGLDRPRLRILTSGHASDGTGGDEFITRTHILTIDGVEVARWRPWLEEGGTLRAANPWSGRGVFGGRERWSSDLDRSGWRPGEIVQPIYFPAPELTPGKHVIALRIEGIRPKDQQGFGYWRVSAAVVADEPWPAEDPKKEP
jgi:hypothetical protein